MSNFLVIDSGGTKAQAVLYDENFRLIAHCSVGSIRVNTTNKTVLQQNLSHMVTALSLKGKTIERLDGYVDPEVLQRLKRLCVVRNFYPVGEITTSLSAAGLWEGISVICGTGSTCGCQYKNQHLVSGGYGSLISDIGSGYWIGRQAFQAAIAHYENFGAPTLLRDWIPERFGGSAETFRETIFSLYKKYSSIPVSLVASMVPLVVQAAQEGDQPSIQILENAGALLAQQLNGLRLSHHLPADLPITTAGSVWKNNPILQESFFTNLRALGVTGDWIPPIFLPAVGGVLWRYMQQHGPLTPEELEHWKQEYVDLLTK